MVKYWKDGKSSYINKEDFRKIIIMELKRRKIEKRQKFMDEITKGWN